jgi:hypothetical protein
MKSNKCAMPNIYGNLGSIGLESAFWTPVSLIDAVPKGASVYEMVQASNRRQRMNVASNRLYRELSEK